MDKNDKVVDIDPHGFTSPTATNRSNRTEVIKSGNESAANVTFAATSTAGPADPPPSPKPLFTSMQWIAAHTFFVALLPLLILYVLFSLCLTGSADGTRGYRRRMLGRQRPAQSQSPRPSSSSSSSTMFIKSTDAVGLLFQKHLQVWITRLGMTALLCLTVNLFVPRFRHVSLIHGLLMWKFFLLIVTVTLGYPIAYLISTSIIGIITLGGHIIRKTPMEYFIMRLEDSIATSFYFGLVFVIWLVYFRTSHGLDRYSKVINDLGTWTLLSLFVGSILWVVKNAILLKWRDKAVHRRFKPKILRAGLQLYFLAFIVGGWKQLGFLIPWRDQVILSTGDEKSTSSRENEDRDDIDEEEVFAHEGLFAENLNGNGRLVSSNSAYMQSIEVSMFEMYSVSESLMSFAHAELREKVGNPEIVQIFEEKIPFQLNAIRNMGVTKENLTENLKLTEEDAYLLWEELKADHSSDPITYEAFLKWMVDAHTNYVLLGYTLIDSMDVIKGLNRVLTLFIVVAVILLWLIVTGIATLKVLVLIGSPVLAFTFVFGDTCKTFFQGVVFSFVTHPFDIGDRCIIDQRELEVKRISIMTTTFQMIGTKEKVVYPNADLANKCITNHEAEPDPRDVIDLVLSTSTTKKQLLDLQDKLKCFLEKGEKGGLQKKYQMMVKEMGNTIKVSVHFTHILGIQDISHSQCFHKKNQQRSAFFIEIKQFLDDLDIKSPTI